MPTFWGKWRRWRRFIRRQVDITGLVFLVVTILTVVMFSFTRDPLIISLLLMLPIALLATFGGWGAGLMGATVAGLLTSPYFRLLDDRLPDGLWMALCGCYLLFGLLVGLQGAIIRRQAKASVNEIEEKLMYARASAERYEAMLEEMSEGQEFLSRMNDELAILNTIATAVNSSLDIKEVQHTAMTHIGGLLNIDEAQIYWIDDDGGHFELLAARPLTDEQVVEARKIALDEGLLGRMVKTQDAVAISEITRDLDLRPPTMSADVKSITAIPLRTRSRLFGALVLGRNSGRSFSEDDEKFLGSVGRVLALAIENARLFTQTQELSLADDLTGLANRRMFNLHLSAEINHARVTGERLCLIMFDLDHFKLVNDRYLHPTGDQVLRWFAKMVQEDIRGSDLFCRYGGEEFALIAPDLTLADAGALARRIVRHIAGTPFVKDDGTLITITVSAGVACLSEEVTTADALVTAADQALYMAKTLGRNRVEVAETERPLVETEA
ncbi:MAG: sensor domain-containing diguanylate cyclase [Armatimonadota bacterium]